MKYVNTHLQSEGTELVNDKSSIDYLYDNAITKQGLSLVGAKLLYMNKEQQAGYKKKFGESLEERCNQYKSVLILTFRGCEVFDKLNRLIGHFDPIDARRTGEESLRAKYGKSIDENCVHLKKANFKKA